MKIGQLGASRRDIFRLFEGESVAGLDEGELLERFATRRDEAAFEALVARLGPMVLGVCRRMLADPHDVDDAFQATFLVLVKKAGSIRDRDLVAAWLYGVALKVARRARADSARRKARERVAVVPESVEIEDSVGVESGWLELRTLIDEEIGRLPEAHRRAVVLCDVEGLSREEAALRLGWSLNMVRGRLERARSRLRGQLARRGVAPSGAWAALMVAPPTPSPALLATTTRAALAFSVGRIGTGLASASAVALSQGVLRMMMLSKLKLGLAVLVSAGFVAGGSGMLAAQAPGDKPGAEAADPFRPAAPPAQAEQKPEGTADPFRPRSAADLAKARVEAALQRYKTQRTFYEEGRITTDRLVDASRGLMQAELDANAAKIARVEAVRAHYNRLKEILRREEAELEVGRATQADVAEMRTALLDAEFALAKEMETPEAKPADVASKGRSDPLADPRMNPAASGTRKLEANPGRSPFDLDPPGPAASGARKLEGRSPLAARIEEFNEEALNTPAGRGQPPLTLDEVIAAIRFFKPPQDAPVRDALLDEFRKIAETEQLPPGSRFETIQLMDPGGDFLFEGWWVRLEMPRGDGGTYAFPIRSRVLRSVTLEEALASAEKRLNRGPLTYLKGTPSGRRVMEKRVETLKARIEKRDKVQ